MRCHIPSSATARQPACVNRLALVAAALVLTWGGPLARCASALEVDEVTWGFDGQVVRFRFNIVSLLVRNADPDPFRGTLQLRRLSGGGTPVDAPLLDEDVYLGPGERRWVQFYPYILNQHDGWEFAWGRGLHQATELPTPRFGEAAQVVLAAADGLRGRGGAWKQFPESLFPPSVTATDGLAAIALDHVPRWEAARRIALLDWLHRGGTLHVFESDAGRPEFPEELNVLNGDAGQQRIGAGRIVRHAATLAEAGPEHLPLKVPAVPSEAATDDPLAADATAAALWEEWDTSQIFFSNLKSMTRPNHNWGAIHLLSLLYLLLIFPGCWLLGGKRADYRTVLAAVFGLVAAFSWAFSYVGRRGYGETTAVHSVAIARPVAGGHYDVTAWSDAFVTDGDKYAIVHGGTGRLYSTCQTFERVNGAIRIRPDAAFVVDIPPYSSRTFSHRMKVAGKPPAFQVESWRGTEDALEELVLTDASSLPSSTVSPHLLYRDKVYVPLRRDGRLVFAGAGQPVGGFLQLDQHAHHQYSYGYDPWSRTRESADTLFQRLFSPLVARSLGLTNPRAAAEFSLPAGQARLFVYAPMPESFFIGGDALGRQAGRVLYCIDLDLAETP